MGSPERPIGELSDDRLGREPFLKRLIHALINPHTGTSTGIVIGVTGPWGSGKSSLLNLLHKKIQLRNPEAVVIRFNLWLISWREDLIASFMMEVITELRVAPSRKETLTKIAGELADYAAPLAPLGSLLAPGAGSTGGDLLGVDHKPLVAELGAARGHLSPQAAIAAKLLRRHCRLHGRADSGELICGQGLLREQQAGAFVEIGMARAQDVGCPAEGLLD
jgi:hypothetical protein